MGLGWVRVGGGVWKQHLMSCGGKVYFSDQLLYSCSLST